MYPVNFILIQGGNSSRESVLLLRIFQESLQINDDLEDIHKIAVITDGLLS